MLTPLHKEKIEYLKQYKYLDADIDRKIKSLEDWRSKILNVTGTLSDMPKSNKRSDKIADGIATINEIEETINKEIDELIELKAEIEGKINAVEDLRLRELLKCRYLDFKSFEEIAYLNGYSWRHVFRLHELALDEIEIGEEG